MYVFIFILTPDYQVFIKLLVDYMYLDLVYQSPNDIHETIGLCFLLYSDIVNFCISGVIKYISVYLVSLNKSQ